MSVCYPQSGEDGFILHPNHALPHGCWWELKSKHKYLSYLFSTSWSREETVHPCSLVLLSQKRFVFGVLLYSQISPFWTISWLNALGINFLFLYWKQCSFLFLYYYGVCVGISQYRDKVCSSGFVFIWGCSAQLSKWHFRDLNVVLTNNSPTFDPSSFFIIEQIFFLLILVASTRGVQGQGEGFDAESLYTVIIQIGAHPRFLLEWLQLLVCKNYVFTRQIIHLDCLWGPNLKFAKN